MNIYNFTYLFIVVSGSARFPAKMIIKNSKNYHKMCATHIYIFVYTRQRQVSCEDGYQQIVKHINICMSTNMFIHFFFFWPGSAWYPAKMVINKCVKLPKCMKTYQHIKNDLRPGPCWRKRERDESRASCPRSGRARC